jgi:hypothetical protein
VLSDAEGFHENPWGKVAARSGEGVYGAAGLPSDGLCDGTSTRRAN